MLSCAVLPGAPSYQTLQRLLPQRAEGLPRPPHRAGRQLGQVYRYRRHHSQRNLCGSATLLDPDSEVKTMYKKGRKI